MKSFLFLTLLAVALFAQVISVNGDVEFSTLIDALNQKASGYKVKMPKLNFLVKVTNDINKAMTTLNKPMPIFITAAKKQEVSRRIPNSFKTKTVTYQTLLEQIDAENTKIGQHVLTISAQIQHKLPAAEYDEWFQRWQKNVEKAHIENIAKIVPSMLPPFANYDYEFNFYVNSTVILRKKIDKVITAAGELYDKLLISTKAKEQKELVKKVIEKMEEYRKYQTGFETRLDQLQRTLSFYNDSRTMWSKFILSSSVVEAAKYEKTIQFGKFPPLKIPKGEK
ncbi:uncharacterized protein LOC116343741 [Contarinia nasturtii]|uniref:uncharacterized protein LOC116343741 n=1 Tax=Contarinia nasturtii TaxID=265458 RepID=UPI0012D3D227|nr:uncharacterized protein LOC116343741 [Contarinia nasturtii]